jgi:hypothetical protein
MKYFRDFFSFLILLLVSFQAFGQTAVEGVVVTGEVTDIAYCGHKDNVWAYNLKIKLQAKNISDQSVLISSYSALIYYYKISNSLDSLKTKEFNHIGWITGGSPGDPKSVPDNPVKPFKIIAPSNSIDIATELRLIFTSEPKYGETYLQVVGENLPDYSKDYVTKIRQAWSSYGSLWKHSLHSEPISFVLSSNLKEAHCQ